MSATPADAGSGLALPAVLDWLAAQLLAPPDEADIASMRSATGTTAMEVIALEWQCDDAIHTIRGALDSPIPAATLALDLSVAYTRLFEGVAGRPAVSLYESGSRPFGQATDDMAALLRQCNLQVSGINEPPDHIAMELALYAALLRDGDAEGVARMHRRLDAWIPRWSADCRQHDADGFYGGIAQLLQALLKAPGLDALENHQHKPEGSRHAQPY